MTGGDRSTQHRTSTIGRRQFVGALGAAGLVSTAGCLGGVLGTGEPTESIDATYGWIGETADTEPAKEPDHTVTLSIRPREQGPPEFFFEPTGLAIESGDVVKFVAASPDHAVNAFHTDFGRTPRVPEGTPGLTSPMLKPGSYWLYEFETTGVYDLVCTPHETFGMVMRVVVEEATGPGASQATAEQTGQLRPPMEAAVRVLNDEALAPDAILDAGRVSWEDLAAESKAPAGGGDHGGE
ncbi:plastocyanin/azurin family copper-binding protein [Haloarchaeobius amylolyticus]|uniref:plastocyanin/azurin family copper-binding protein n=1 Tax=Haloarchaeobius amylolyticus TaxID=1198296 RepID=UPI00226EC8C9|nr:plastocyanin/azurin family copper-binding protein [Haloarchaeobius amylolyticus]